MLCIRSGNVSQADQNLYFRSGADCVLDKELTYREMARQLAREYTEWSARQPDSRMRRESRMSASSLRSVSDLGR